MTIKTLYLHENLECVISSSTSERYVMLDNKKDNTHFKFLKEVTFEEDWVGHKTKSLLEFN